MGQGWYRGRIIARAACRALGLLALVSPAFSAHAEPTERIRVSTVKGFYTTALQELADRYVASHPNLEIDINLQPDNLSLMRYYTAQMAADRRDAPDIVHGNILGVAENYHAGRFLACNDYLKEPNPYAGGMRWQDLFDQVFLNSLAVDGIRYCILPMDYVSVGVYYNKDLFRKAGVEPVKNWRGWFAISQTFIDHDVIPIAMAGSAQTPMRGWLEAQIDDACLRRYTPLFLAQPGDWNYAPANAAYVHDANDLLADQLVTLNPERMLKAYKEGKVRFDSPACIEGAALLQQLTPYLELGHLGTDQAGAYALFLSGRAAMWLTGSWRVGTLTRDMADLPPDKRFDWGVFPVPDIEHSEHGIAPLRSVGGAGHQLSVVDKHDEAQHRRVIDFLKFIYAPKQAAYLTRRTLEVGEFIQGAPMMEGVTLPPDIAEKLDGFGQRGYLKMDIRPDPNDMDTNLRLRAYGQLLAMSAITPEEYTRERQRLAMRLVDKLIARRGFDLDPTTEDTPP